MTETLGLGAEPVAHYTRRHSKLARRVTGKVPPYGSGNKFKERFVGQIRQSDKTISMYAANCDAVGH